MKTIGIVVFVLGILGVLLGAAVTVISLLLPELTNGRTSWDEAMLGLIPGIIVLVFSLLVTVVGAVVFFVGRKKASQ
jgi:hypothetical protein